MICKNCDKKIVRIKDYHTRSMCTACRNEYMKDYQEGRRWLNGGPDKWLMGEELPDKLSIWDETEGKYI